MELKFINKIKSLFNLKPDPSKIEEEVDIFEQGELKEEISSKLSKEEISRYSRILHTNDNKAYEKTQSGLCFTVIGSIFLIIAVLFFILSFVKQTNVIVGINVFSMQFYIFIISVVIGGLSLTYGLYKTITSHLRRKTYQKEINILAKLKD